MVAAAIQGEAPQPRAPRGRTGALIVFGLLPSEMAVSTLFGDGTKSMVL